MKKSFLLSFFILFCFSIFGLDVPGPVIKTFNDKYPGAKSVKWEMNEGAYEAEFKWKGVKYSAEFDASGNWLLQTTEMKFKDLPMAIQRSIDSLYEGAKIKEVELQEAANQGPNYIIELIFDTEELELYYTPSGELINIKKD